MKQIEILEQLKERIIHDGIIEYYYAKEDDETGECKYCVVGHLLNICGVEPVRLVNLGKKVINKVYYYKPFVKSFIDSSGLELEFLNKLQLFNDRGDIDDVIECIDEKILELMENV